MGEMMIVMEKIDCADPDCAGMDTNNNRLTDCCQRRVIVQLKYVLQDQLGQVNVKIVLVSVF